MNPYDALSKEVEEASSDLMKDESYYVPRRRAQELFSLPDGAVQVFFVSNEGKVSTFSEPTCLRIYRFNEQVEEEQWKPVFIQVSGWTHPLIPGASPVLEAGNGAIMFPDVYHADSTTISTAAVGLILSDNVGQTDRDQLLAILEEHTALKKDESLIPNDQQNLGRLGRAILTGAQYVSKGLEVGTEKAINLIDYVGEKNSSPSVESRDVVNPALKMTAKGAKYATNATVKVSGFVAKRVGSLTHHLSKYLANQATPTLGSGMSKSSSYQTLIDGARGGLLAYGTVYSSLEESAKILGSSIKENTVKVVSTKYGSDSAEMFDDSLTAAGNAAMTYMNIQSLGVKGIIKKTAKSTGKEIGKNVLENHSS